MITTPQEYTGEHPRPVSFLLKGLIRRSPLSKNETGRGCSPVYSCGVVIMDLLVDRCCFSFSIDSLWFPARRCDISGTLVVPLVVFIVLGSLLGVPRALFFWQGTLAWRDAYAWCRFASLFSIAALLKLVFSLFFRLMSPLSKDETGRGCSPVYSCGVVIMDLLVDRCCFSFSINFLTKKISRTLKECFKILFKLARKMWRFFTRTAFRNRLKKFSEKEWRNGFRKALHTRAKMTSYV